MTTQRCMDILDTLTHVLGSSDGQAAEEIRQELRDEGIDIGGAIIRLKMALIAKEESKPELDLDSIYQYHKPKPGQAVQYEDIRAKGKRLAVSISEECPDSREKDVALIKVEEAVMWANAAIARNG